ALSLLVGGLSLYLLRRQLAPLGRLHQHMLETHAAAHYVPYEAEHSPDELGDLARTFDRLMTERESVQQRLEASESDLREVLRQAGDAFVAIDRNARITEWNRQAEVIFGYSREQALGRPLAQLMVPAPMRAGCHAGMEAFLRTGTGPLVGKRTELNAQHRDGHTIPIELSINAMHMDDHFIAHAFMRDISERRAAEERITASRKLLQDIADNMPSLVARLDSSLRYTFVNEHIQRAYPGKDLIGKSMQEIYDETEFLFMEPWTQKALSGQSVTFEKQGAKHTCYADRRYELSYIPDKDADGHVQGFYAMSFDITERKLAERVIVDNEAKLRGITDNLPALVAQLDAYQRFTFINSEVRDWWGKEPASLIGHTMREVVGEMFYARVEPMLQRALAGERVEFESQRTVNGELRDAHSIFVPEINATGAVISIFVLTINITELKTAQRKLALLARVDPLTQLVNRVAFNETMPLMLARSKRSGDALAVMYLDIDHFKAINDTLGHAAGDEVLCEFARRLQTSVRTTDLVVRLAGDEFVVVLENLSGPEVASAVAEKIVGQVARPVFHVHDKPLSITTSIGIVFHASTSPPTTPAELLARADGALYLAKAGGRNRFEFAL
ncbi:MAG: diguanylate cyclase domain-containing protein, partial [Giesbergeria sp.]